MKTETDHHNTGKEKDKREENSGNGENFRQSSKTKEKLGRLGRPLRPDAGNVLCTIVFNSRRNKKQNARKETTRKSKQESRERENEEKETTKQKVGQAKKETARKRESRERKRKQGKGNNERMR